MALCHPQDKELNTLARDDRKILSQDDDTIIKILLGK